MRIVPKKKCWQFNIYCNKHEPKAPGVRDTVTKERDSESDRSTSRDEARLEHERYPKMKKSMTQLPNQSKRSQTHSSCVTQLGDIIDANPSSYGRSYDQRVTNDHGEWFLGYDFKTQREVCSVFHIDIQYKARFVVCLRKNRLWHDILYWLDILLQWSRSIYQAKNHLYRIGFVRAQKETIDNHIHELETSPRVINILAFDTR